MKEENALSNAPKRSGPELVRASATLRDAVGETFPHVVNDKIRVKIRRLIRERHTRAGRGAARFFAPVVNEGVWQCTQPMTGFTDYRDNFRIVDFPGAVESGWHLGSYDQRGSFRRRGPGRPNHIGRNDSTERWSKHG